MYTNICSLSKDVSFLRRHNIRDSTRMKPIKYLRTQIFSSHGCIFCLPLHLLVHCSQNRLQVESFVYGISTCVEQCQAEDGMMKFVSKWVLFMNELSAILTMVAQSATNLFLFMPLSSTKSSRKNCFHSFLLPELIYHKITVGKIYASYLIIENWKATRAFQGKTGTAVSDSASPTHPVSRHQSRGQQK